MGDFNINLLKDQALEILTMLPGVTQTIKKFDGLSCTLLDHIYVKNLKIHTAVVILTHCGHQKVTYSAITS